MKKAVISILALIVIGTLSDLRALADNCSNYGSDTACLSDNECYWAKNKLFSGDDQATCVPRNSDRCFLDEGQFRDENGKCQTCPKGYYCPAYQMNAIRCPEGETTAATGKSQQADCINAIDCTVYSKPNCKNTAGCYWEEDNSNCYANNTQLACLSADGGNCKWLGEDNQWHTNDKAKGGTRAEQPKPYDTNLGMCSARLTYFDVEEFPTKCKTPTLNDGDYFPNLCTWRSDEESVCNSVTTEKNCKETIDNKSFCEWNTELKKCISKSRYCGELTDMKECEEIGFCNPFTDAFGAKTCRLKSSPEEHYSLEAICNNIKDQTDCDDVYYPYYNYSTDNFSYLPTISLCKWVTASGEKKGCISIFAYCNTGVESDCEERKGDGCAWDSSVGRCKSSVGLCVPMQCQSTNNAGGSCKTCTPGHYCKANSEEKKSCTNLATSPTAAGTADQCLHECTFITSEDHCSGVAGCYWNSDQSDQGACDFCPEGYYCPADKSEKIECPFGGKSISPAKSITDCYLGRRYEYDIKLSHKICDNTGNCITIGPVEKCEGGTCSPINLGKQKKALIYR